MRHSSDFVFRRWYLRVESENKFYYKPRIVKFRPFTTNPGRSNFDLFLQTGDRQISTFFYKAVTTKSLPFLTKPRLQNFDLFLQSRDYKISTFSYKPRQSTFYKIIVRKGAGFDCAKYLQKHGQKMNRQKPTKSSTQCWLGGHCEDGGVEEDTAYIVTPKCRGLTENAARHCCVAKLGPAN